jgi:DNA-binding GntR family transcriptional regulator
MKSAPLAAASAAPSATPYEPKLACVAAVIADATRVSVRSEKLVTVHQAIMAALLARDALGMQERMRLHS